MANVMVVDDAVFMRMTIKKMLEAHGHSVIGEAGNGVEAVKKYVEIRPDVVLLDITMPDRYWQPQDVRVHSFLEE